MGDEITAQEVEETVQKLNSGKSPDMNILLAEFFHCVGLVLMGRLTTLLQTAWRTEAILEDWRNSLLVVLYKGKGHKNDCSNYRGISLLSVVGKILSRIIFRRINLHIADNILPEKCQKQRKDPFQMFIDLTKAFDTVNREALWLILRKLGCPEKLIFILKLFHYNMKTTLNVEGKLV